ncbi:MAG: hypothetical protein WC050_04200 [Candidatus Paceibacterota bacterium]
MKLDLKHRMRGTALLFVMAFAVIAFLAGFFSFLLVRSYFALETAQQQIQSVVGLQTGGGGITRYGVVDHVDQATRTLVMRSFDSFSTEAQTTTLSVHVSNGALIALQTLSQHDGAFDSLSTRMPASLSDIQSGDRVAVLIVVEPNGALGTNLVLFGSPL